jgi:hypothetical protein
MIPDKAETMESMRQSFRGISWGDREGAARSDPERGPR